MTEAEISHLYRAAQAELDQNETAMLISPLALCDLIEMLHARDAKIEALGAYDELHS